MSIYKRNGIWWVYLTSSQGRIRRSAGTTDKTAATEYYKRLKDQIWRQERLGEAPPITWLEAVTKWLSSKPRGMPDKYRLRAMPISPSQTLPLSISEMEASLSGMGAGSYNRCLALIIAIHNESGVTPEKLKKKPNPEGRTRWLTAEEWVRLKETLYQTSPLLASCAAFTLATGLRENNVLQLEWSQVDMRRRVAWIHGDQAKAGAPIGVPLNDDAVAVLNKRRGIHKRFVFGNPDYVLYKASNRAWYQALRDAKLVGFRWHDLRHTWAAWHVMNGTRIEELQRLGGWKTLQMVQRYAHLASEHLAGVAANVKPVSLSVNE